MKTVLIWDLENISYRYRDEVLNLIPVDTVKYIVSKQNIAKKKITKLKKDGFTIFSADFHDTADLKIESIMKIISLNTEELYIISSDADFVAPSIKAKKHINKIHFVVDDHNKRGILMNANLTDKQFRFHVVGVKKNKKKFEQKPFQKWTEKEKVEIEDKRKERKLLKNKFLRYLEKNFSLTKIIEKKEKVKIDGKTYSLTFDEWLDKQVERLTNKRIVDYSNHGTCSICHKEELSVKIAGCYDSMICQECEREWIYFQKELKTLFLKEYKHISHQDRFLYFFEKMDIEFKINGNIHYRRNGIELSEIELNNLNIPDCFLAEEDKSIIYKDDFVNNPFDVLKQ